MNQGAPRSQRVRVSRRLICVYLTGSLLSVSLRFSSGEGDIVFVDSTLAGTMPSDLLAQAEQVQRGGEREARAGGVVAEVGDGDAGLPDLRGDVRLPQQLQEGQGRVAHAVHRHADDASLPADAIPQPLHGHDGLVALDLEAELLADQEVVGALGEAKIRESFDLNYHLKNVDTIFKRVFGE